MKITKNLARTLKNCLGKDWRQKVRDLDFRYVNFRGADFSGADFRGANFGGAYFGGANFRGANFRGANFGGAYFGGANFGGAYFGDANFGGANFGGANFRDAYFGDANFGDAYFGGANFRDANFGGANFRDANFDNYEKIHLIALANACIYPLNITLQILKEAKEKTEAWKQNKTPIPRKCDDYDACESGWKKAFGSEDYVITDNELHAFWFFCWSDND